MSRVVSATSSVGFELLTEESFDIELYAYECSQWATPEQLEASIELVFDAITFDLRNFGEDLAGIPNNKNEVL